VIHQYAVLQAWADSSEPDYGEPTCPKCGNVAVMSDSEGVPDFTEEHAWELASRYPDYACIQCRYAFDADEAFGDEPNAFVLDDGEYKACSDDYGDVFILKSPYYTHAEFCSPCAPGACHLGSPADENGPRAYCFGPDWFDESPCPYSVYRVDNNECIYKP